MTGWGELHGYPIGVLANLDGAFTPAETQKAVHFIQLANATDTTLLFVQYTGSASTEEREAADVRHGAPLVHAVAKSTVPHLTLMIGATPAEEMGGVYGRAYEPRFLFSWPVERPADRGPEPAPQAAGRRRHRSPRHPYRARPLPLRRAQRGRGRRRARGCLQTVKGSRATKAASPHCEKKG